MTIKLLIFDFDGTLADTKKVWYNSIIKFLKKENVFCPECEAKIAVHFGKKITDVLENIGVDKKKAKSLSIKISNEVYKKLKPCKSIDKIKNIRIKKVLISNSRTFFLKKSIKKMELNNVFSEVIGGEKFDIKEQVFKIIFKKYNLSPKEVVYIGDTANDIKIAKKTKCVGISISNSCSFNLRKEILKEKPDFIVGSLKELKNIIKGTK